MFDLFEKVIERILYIYAVWRGERRKGRQCVEKTSRNKPHNNTGMSTVIIVFKYRRIGFLSGTTRNIERYGKELFSPLIPFRTFYDVSVVESTERDGFVRHFKRLKTIYMETLSLISRVSEKYRRV